MKIALIAMSGVRVRSRELQELGVSLPGFVERGKVIASLPSLGLLTIAGATPAELEAAGYDIVAVSTFTAQAPEAYALLDRCRAMGLRVAIGGLHATVLPEEAARHADHVFVGEAEETWPEFLTDLRMGRPKRIYDARGRVFPFNRAPRPRYDLLDPDRYNRITVQTTRSCPHRCTFCASGILLRGPYRKKPIELADDNTFVDKRWGRELVDAFVPYELKWFTESDLTLADDLPLVDALAGSGCRTSARSVASRSAV